MRHFHHFILVFIYAVMISACAQKNVPLQSPYNDRNANRFAMNAVEALEQDTPSRESLTWQALDQDARNKIIEAVSTSPTYKSMRWINPNDNTQYTAVPLSNFIVFKGHKNCRRYRLIETQGDQKRHLYGVLCKEENGDWDTLQ